MFIFYAALVASIGFGVAGQFLLKAGAATESFAQQLIQPPTIIGLSCYALAAGLYMVALRQIPLSVAYPSVSASYVLVVLVSVLALGETLSWVQAGGIGLICLGVLMLFA